MLVVRKYNRKMPAPLPVHMMVSRTAVGVPSSVDTRAFCVPVNDQGSEGCCTGEAGSEAGGWIDRKYLKGKGDYSPQFTYVNELIAQGNFPQDDGSDGTTLCTTI